MTDYVFSLQEKAQQYCALQHTSKPEFLTETRTEGAWMIFFNRRSSWTFEEFFVSLILLMFTILVSSVAFLIVYSRTDIIFLGLIGFLLVFLPLFYLDFIWLFSKIQIQVEASGITKTQHFGIFKKEHSVSITEIKGFGVDSIELYDGAWKVVSDPKTNAYLVFAIANFYSNLRKNTK